ncbi:biotin carboxyl carrier protein of acetyl-CoA carboxylase (plasmid) [Sinorhizobium americanum]|uniref:Biotin carboxyl carrier protein of acetyl-CoA carboxylase n=2 Tax=Sinorhizobium americanum TaxID=194963 RepID=A0A1L3LYA9_9HYPH|nr:biotin carboxyl carrier protein of acetyl-CoA carboxylase [Sinorhizobium americanum]
MSGWTAMDLETIKTLIDFVGRSRVSELTVSEHGTTVRISAGLAKRTSPVPIPNGRRDRIVEVTPADGGEIARGDSSRMVKAPVFGVLHRSPNPGAPAFVEVGDVVGVGQNLCIVEAMKVFNTVSAHRAGPITRILAGDGQEVEAGQPLMEIG